MIIGVTSVCLTGATYRVLTVLTDVLLIIPVLRLLCVFSGYMAPCVFFFFQAEDGIRDLYVTGVKTCALPISRRTDSCARSWWCHRGDRPASAPGRSSPRGLRIPRPAPRDPESGAGSRRAGTPRSVDRTGRSEERRVGKECRSGWSPDQEKK